MSFAVDLLAMQAGRVAGIWFVLLLLGAMALAGLALPRGVRRPRQISTWLTVVARHRRIVAAERDAERAESARWAEEITVAARGAAETARRRREQWHETQQRVEETWQAYQATDAVLDRARRAAAYAPPATARTPAQYAEREQSLHRLARAAHRRGDLSDAQLADALTHRNGWDPRLHPVEQELVLARAAVLHRSIAYRQAVTAEAHAWQAADIATAAVRTLRREVTAAAASADRTRPVHRRPTRTGAVIPGLVAH